MNTSVSTGHITAALELPAPVDGEALARQVDRFLPGGWHLTPATTAGGEARVVVEDALQHHPEVSVHGQMVRLRLPHQALTSATLGYVVYTALERARQQRQMLTLHANAMISPSGLAVVLLGNKGAGKTSTILALAERGWTHAGDDLIVLTEHSGGLAVLPGKPTAAVRPPAAPDRWDAPKPLIDLAPFATGPADVTLFVRLTVHPAQPVARMASAIPFNTNEVLRLSEATARYISGLPTPLTGPTRTPYAPVWPLDTPDLALWRGHVIDRMEAGPYAYLRAPSAAHAADLITKEITT
ncbi:hypothetical protein [Streptomyces sp. NBC_01304]|uniref:hypothetical protein n=1 Tax=Streptomyces sp. NBC_01304 TaxID=2903818 RepID=UPI002E118C24|nr:hypothetical protein OG430_47955 [Streptomyces sp. NBC_01304]